MIYSFYIFYFFEHVKKEGEKKIIKICKICGYIIYSEHRIKKPSNFKECCRSCGICCKLGCENIQNCCNKTFCDVIKNFCCCCCKCCQKISCTCKSCVYNENDYQKEEEVWVSEKQRFRVNEVSETTPERLGLDKKQSIPKKTWDKIKSKKIILVEMTEV